MPDILDDRTTAGPALGRARSAASESRLSAKRGIVGLALVLATAAGLFWPAAASAHGPVAPIASNYLARVDAAPPGIEAKVVDGDLLMWLRVRRGLTATVLDYRGAPYLRFSPAGIYVNENSSMFFLNQSPVALTPPANLNAGTPPHWHKISGGSSYRWHDGRLHALASVALLPGSSLVGHWRLPLLVDGRRTALSGRLWHADAPSIVWFWPIVVLMACVLAGWRLRRPSLDRLLARGLGIAALIGLSAAALTRELHGRPAVTIWQLIELAIVLAFALWALHRVLLRPHGYFLYLMIALFALWQGVELTPTLVEGFSLAAGPAVVVRAAAVVCLATAISLLLLVFRLADERDGPGYPAQASEFEDDSAWELA